MPTTPRASTSASSANRRASAAPDLARSRSADDALQPHIAREPLRPAANPGLSLPGPSSAGVSAARPAGGVPVLTRPSAKPIVANGVTYKATSTLNNVKTADGAYEFEYREPNKPAKKYFLYISPDPSSEQLKMLQTNLTHLVELVRKKDENFSSVTFAGGGISPSGGVEYLLPVGERLENRKLWTEQDPFVPGTNDQVCYHTEVERHLEALKKILVGMSFEMRAAD